MSVDSVRKFFIEKGLEDPVFELKESGATVEQASETIGVEPELIAKTLAFRLSDRDILIVMKGDSRVDNKKFKNYFKVKAKMLKHDEVNEVTGHPVGGVCPFGLKNKLDIYIDISLSNLENIYPAAGADNAAMKISPGDMVKLTDAKWADVCTS